MPQPGPGRGYMGRVGQTMEWPPCRTVLLLLCLTFSTVTVLGNARHRKPKPPKLETTWKVTYNATGTVTPDCGKYYASFFLQQFLKTQPSLFELCNKTTTISIASVARVRIFHHQILLSTFLYFTGTTPRAAMNCVSKLKEKFKNIQNLANVSTIRQSIEQNCTMATMATHALGWDADGCHWSCPQNWTLVGESTCEMNNSNAHIAVCQPTQCEVFTECFIEVKQDDSINCENVARALQCLRKQRDNARDRGLYSTCWGKVEPFISATNCSGLNIEQLRPPEMCTSTSTTTKSMGTTTTATTTSTTTSTTTTTTTKPTTVTTPTTTTTQEPSTLPPPTDWHVNLTQEGLEIKNGKPTLVLHEGETKNITFNTWGNVTSLCGGVAIENCTLYMQLSFKDSSPIRCNKTGSIIDQVVVGPPIFSNDLDDKNFCKHYLDVIQLAKNGEVRTTTRAPGYQQREFWRRLYGIKGEKEVLQQIEPLQVTFSLRGRSDFTYDNQTVEMTLALKREIDNMTIHSLHLLDIEVTDVNWKATCQSINDPHITTFDGLAYDNLFQGEFILYKHKTLPFQVNVVYQACSIHVNESCNCAVAIKSGDDVIEFNRCHLEKILFYDLQNHLVENNKTILTVTMYKNRKLTQGTRIYEADQGLKYLVYLPTGTYIKVKPSSEFLNVWVLGSPNDWKKTEGLCGSYNGDPSDDILLNGTTIGEAVGSHWDFTKQFLNDLNVEMYGSASLLLGVSPTAKDYDAEKFSVCSEDSEDGNSIPDINGDVDMCKILEGKDVTEFYSQRAPDISERQDEKTRRRRQIRALKARLPKEPIIIEKGFVPHENYTWASEMEKNISTQFCKDYVRFSKIGKLCAPLSNVNFEQEINTCILDVAITKTRDWADSAEDAMKEQCLEELKRNSSIDPNLAMMINDANCPNKCSNRGTCEKGKCNCTGNYAGVDCSASPDIPPDSVQINNYGLCDTEKNDCSRVIVYGDNFVQSPELVCVLFEAIVRYTWYSLSSGSKYDAKYINFNAVECPIPQLRPYVLSVSNDDGNTMSESLLFIPYNGECLQCSTNNKECNQTADTCVIDNTCYTSLALNPQDECQICHPNTNSTQWDSVPVCSLLTVISIGAIVGSVVGIAIGILLYILCCRRTSGQKQMGDHITRSGRNGFNPELRPVSDDRLHRNHEVQANQFPQSLDSQHHNYREPYMQNYGQGVENGVDDTTYF